MANKTTNNLQVPIVGQYVMVDFITSNAVPIKVIGRCIDVRWRGIATVFTLINNASKQTFPLFSPNTLQIRCYIPRNKVRFQ